MRLTVKNVLAQSLLAQNFLHAFAGERLRELPDGDYTSGIYARALAAGDVTIDMLERCDAAAIAQAIKAGGHEAYFLERWSQLRRRLVELAPQVRSVNLGSLLQGYD